MEIKKKVCHFSSVHSNKDTRIFFKECVSLASGYEVFIVSQGESREEKGVHVIGLGEAPKSRKERVTKFAKKVYEKALGLDCDIYHFHDPELLPYGLKLKRAGKKVIFDSHENTLDEILDKSWIPAAIRKPAYLAFSLYQKYVCQKLDAIISVTPHVCEYFKTINNNTWMVTNYPILKEKLPSSRKKARTICFAGGISEQWKHDLIIKALENVPDCQYIMCGWSWDEDKFLNYLKTLPAWEKVDFKGKLPHEQVNEVLSSCCIGLSIHSYTYNTGFKTGTLGNTKLFEEMMAGLPVICTDFDLWKEIIDKYNCGICVNPNSVEEITAAINKLLDNPELAEELGKNGRRAVEEEYNWATQEAKLLELYKSLEEKN